jgi:hypothetical protein
MNLELAPELGLEPQELASMIEHLTPGLVEALASALLRFDDALDELKAADAS